jgi:Coenzyme PQQ synthesis protein D (PqqD)
MSGKQELEGVNLLDLAPERVAEWEEAGDRVVLLRPPPKGRGLRFALDWVACHLSSRRIRLDEIGSFVWKGLDGATTVGALAEALERQFGERVTPVGERLGKMVRVLRKEGFVRYPTLDPPS